MTASRKKHRRSTALANASERLAKALRQVRNLIGRLRSGSPPDEEQHAGDMAFYEQSLGGVRLSGSEVRRYRDALETLLSLHGANPDHRPLSRSATEKLLRTVILRVIRPKMPQTDSRETFKRRLDREMRRFRKELLAMPQEWIVTVQLYGLAPQSLPFTFGAVEFVAGTPETAAQVAAGLEDFAPKRRVSAEKRAAEQQVREHERAKLVERFAQGTLASTTVRAVDSDAAKHLGVERIRRHIDVLNFFAPFIHSRPSEHRAFVAPDAYRSLLSWTVRPVKGDTFHWSSPMFDRPEGADDPISMIDLGSPRAREVGLARASELLALGAPSDLHGRIINALSWAGRACTEHRRDVAFLLFTISLEALLTKPTARAGVTDRLRLRATRLIGQLPETRRLVYERMGHLYEVRSSLVHAGDSTDLTDEDLREIRRLAQYALTGILTDTRLVGIDRAVDFERWLDDQLLA